MNGTMKTLVRKIDSDIFTTFFIYHLLPVFLPYFKLIAINIDSERLILFDIPFALFSSPSAFPAYIHSCIQTYMQARKHASMHSHIHACMCTCMHACMHAYIHTYMHSYTHTYMLAFIHTYIHACMHACIHTYMHTYIHALVCNHGSAYFSSLPWMFIYFFHFQDWFSSVFFFRSLSHQLSSLCHCFSLFMFIHFHVVVTCYPFGIVFTWPLFWYMLSSMLVICNCFIFRFHHISYIYSCPSPSILFQRDPKKPSRRSSNLQNPYINFDTTNAILHKKLQWVQEIMYAMHAVCLISCLRLATEQHCILPQKGVNGKVYLIIHELKTHSGRTPRFLQSGAWRGSRGRFGFRRCFTIILPSIVDRFDIDLE